MGVTYISQYKVVEGKTIQQGAEELQNVVEQIGAKKSGLFGVECESFQSTNVQNSKTLHMIYNSEFPASRFGFFEEGSFLVADIMLGSFLSKLRSIWQPKKGGKIEIKGHRYELGDFIIKVGIVSVGPNTKGVAFEVEYGPCMYLRDCWGLMIEMLQMVVADQAPTTLPQIVQQKNEVGPAELMMHQYVEMFNNIRKVNVTI